MLYPAPGIRVPSPPPPPLEEVDLAVEGVGRVSAWYTPGQRPGPALVFFHGNGENLETLRLSQTLDSFAELGFPSLAVDYPGYGRSEGKAAEPHLVAAARQAYEWMGDRHPERPLVAVGWSLGAAVAIQAASDADLAGMILMSPWTSLADVGREHYPSWLVGAFVRESYDTLAAAADLRVPVLVLHGERDAIIPARHGRLVAEALEEARFVEVPRRGHNDLLGDPLPWMEMEQFLTGI